MIQRRAKRKNWLVDCNIDAGFAGCVESAPLSNCHASDHIPISHLGDCICIKVTQVAVPGHQVSGGSGGLGS